MNMILKKRLMRHAQSLIAHDEWLIAKFGDNHKTPDTVTLARIALNALECKKYPSNQLEVTYVKR